MNDPIILNREQDNEWKSYPQLTHDLASGGTVTVQQLFDKYRDELNLTDSMIVLVNGKPASMEQYVEQGSGVYFKESTKGRGL